MSKLTNEFLRKAHALRADFVEKLPDRFTAISSGWAQWKNKHDDIESLRETHRNAHSLAGAGATFGFSDVSVKARALDNFLKEYLERGRKYENGDDAKFTELLDELIAVGKENAGSVDSWLRTQEDLQAAVQLRSTPKHENQRLLYIVEDDASFLHEIQRQLMQFGFAIRSFTTLAQFRDALKSKLPSCVVTDIHLPDGDGTDEIIRQRETIPEFARVPVVFVSVRDDINYRLKVVRAGAIAFLPKPIETGELVDKLDAVLNRSSEDKFRILIVDDSQIVTEHTRSILTEAGYAVDAISKPLTVLDKIREFNPDLILMDFYMPECNGLELAKIIRQHNAWLSIPIVYVTTETDAQKKQSFVLEGGDDYIAKPIDPALLLSVVEGRISRSRVLRSLMVRDSLTGLFNHTTVKEKLTNELTRATRLNTTIVYAMIDIDHFKRINDTYGHPVGDRVIKTLARVLQQRLRRTDIIGRYGGEEFALILLDIPIEQASRLLDDVRNAFSMIEFQSGEKKFHVTFSGGLAEFPTINSMPTLCDSADYALYQAKQAGRNQIICFKG